MKKTVSQDIQPISWRMMFNSSGKFIKVNYQTCTTKTPANRTRTVLTPDKIRISTNTWAILVSSHIRMTPSLFNLMLKTKTPARHRGCYHHFGGLNEMISISLRAERDGFRTPCSQLSTVFFPTPTIAPNFSAFRPVFFRIAFISCGFKTHLLSWN